MTDRVVAAAGTYETAAQSARLHTVSAMRATEGERSRLKTVYPKRMVDPAGSGRVVYDEIRSSLAICPFCNLGEVYELDHFLPKGAFPELNVLPINLVPICHPCNHIKLERIPEDRREYFIHPYFDELPDDERWLFADLRRSSNGPVLMYRVELDREHGALAHRLDYHFRELKLDRRFKEASATMLVELEAEIEEHLGNFDESEMAAHFAHLANRSLRLHGNVIETAAYFAAAENGEYCAGGFRS
jgi:hypothetical protein